MALNLVFLQVILSNLASVISELTTSITTITAVEETISEELVIIQASFKELTGAEVANKMQMSCIRRKKYFCSRQLKSRLKRLVDVHKSQKLGECSLDTRR